MYQRYMPTLFQVPQIKISYHNRVNPKDRLKIMGSQHAYDVLINTWDLSQIETVEQCKLVMLDRSHACIGIANIATGSVSACLVDAKIVFGTALKARTSAVILAHNHPSGSLTPSEQDDSLTKKLLFAANILDIHFHDHLIVSPHGYYSYAEHGLILK